MDIISFAKAKKAEEKIETHLNAENPHGITKADVGLGNADDTSDLDKPISTAVQAALDNKVDNSRVLTDVPAGAVFTDTVYTHPAAHPAAMVTEDATRRFVTDTEKADWNAKLSGADIPTKVSQLENDVPYVTADELGEAGLGDMVKSIYDKNNDGIVDRADLADNVPWDGVMDKPIVQQSTPPDGVKEGRLWLDTSDNLYQGTVFDDLNNEVAALSEAAVRKSGGAMTGDLEMGFSKWFKGPVLNLIRETMFGYDGKFYRCIQLGELSSEVSRKKAIAIGIDPFTNPGGAFNGDEIALPNYVEFMQANSDNSDWIQDVLIMDNGILKTGPGKHALWHEGNLDYEEGTWTPGISFGGLTTGITYDDTTTGASYVRVGNFWSIKGFIQLTSKGSATGDVSITGLPVTLSTEEKARVATTLVTGKITFSGGIQACALGTTINPLQSAEDGSLTNLSDANFANNSEIFFSLSFCR